MFIINNNFSQNCVTKHAIRIQMINMTVRQFKIPFIPMAYCYTCKYCKLLPYFPPFYSFSSRSPPPPNQASFVFIIPSLTAILLLLHTFHCLSVKPPPTCITLHTSFYHLSLCFSSFIFYFLAKLLCIKNRGKHFCSNGVSETFSVDTPLELKNVTVLRHLI